MLIATDLDGTFLGPDARVSARNRAAVEAAESAGVHVVPVTGRAMSGLRNLGPVFRRYALVCNGAVGLDLSTDEVLYTMAMSPETVRTFVETMTAHLPGCLFCAAVEDSSVFALEAGYDDLTPPYEAENDPAEHVVVTREELCSREALKLMVAHPTVPAGEVFTLAERLAIPGVHTTWAGFSLAEANRADVNKAVGLSEICRVLGEDRADVVALGDGANDVEMLQWAGISYAMADANPLAVAAADLRAPSCAEDGFAVVVEKILAAG
ncbi:HAD hydrolase family protein [Cutibacterium sp.]|uniref:HAD hydrolase family protein n=1 Tax=Cutibacterium sp. TaxID=1912221 RepID=UPI0026DBCC8E|nr:HAD family hydrolase [Cutibacterium sp.]MDO4412707.1 HAD family hydrolase [Cutibacterium sp.]